MSIFKFVTGAGEKLGSKVFDMLHEDEDIEQPQSLSPERLNQIREAQIQHRVGSMEDIIVQDFKASVNGDTATVSGKVADQAACDRITMAAGNQIGISNVDCQIEVQNPPAPEAPPTIYYEVQSGDTLGKISKEFLGSAGQYMKIFEANQPLLKDPNKIYVGQTLIIPQG